MHASITSNNTIVKLQLLLNSFPFVENFPPTILVGPTELNVTVDTMATITVTAEDPNNDSLTFSVSGTLPSGYTTTNNASSMTITWSVTTDEVIYL